MGKKRAKTEEIEEIIEPDELDAVPKGPHKPHHWSDDGLQYNVMVEQPDSVDGNRRYLGFFETRSLEEAKRECIARADKDGLTGIICDRANWNRECFRHEVKKTNGPGILGPVHKTKGAMETASPNSLPPPKHRRRVTDDSTPTTANQLPRPKHRRSS